MVDADPITRLNAALEGRYRIERKLGEGGMATVYLAEDLKHERKVALKVLKPALAAAMGPERFLAEIRTTANLQHPHILPLFDSGEADGLLYYVMPYVEGHTVRVRLEQEGPLPVEDALRIATHCGEALQHAHERGIIHRDIKPGNVLLSGGHAVVADFGVARALEASVTREALTQTGVSIGTVGYMSPEQASGERAVDARADVYALGCLLHEMLAGEAPFTGSTPYAVLARQLDGPDGVTKIRPSVPKSVELVIRRACEPTPGDRFRTAGDFVEALASGGVQAAVSPRIGATAFGWLMAAAVLVLTAFGAWVTLSNPFEAAPPPAKPGLAVLPFENLSPDPDDAYFAAGIHEELRTQLSKVEGIRLIGRLSVLRYGDRETTMPEIAEDLGVGYVLLGSVRRAGNEVRITVELYDAAQDQQLWSDAYERDLADVFQVQTEVAEGVVAQLGGVLTPDELAELVDSGTDDPEAYTYYLRGQSLFRTLYGAEDARAAAEAFEQAVDRDPDFVAAWSRLVQARLWLVWLWGEPAARGTARVALDRLEDLAPASAELRWAQGLWYYFGVQRYEQALEEFEVVAELWPGDVTVLLYLGGTQRRLGRWDEGIRTWERTLELDPLNPGMASTLAQAYRTVRRFEEAERYGWRSVALDPDVVVYWWDLASVYLSQGDTAGMRIVVDSAGRHVEPEGLESGGWWGLWQVFTGDTAAFELYGDTYRRDPLSLDGTWGRSWDLGLASAAATGRSELVQTFAEDLTTRVADALSTVSSDDVRVSSDLLSRRALAEAYLGNQEESVRLARQAVEMFPVSRDAAQGPDRVRVLAQVLAVVGRREEAVDRLRYLLSIPSGVTVDLLRIDPRWHGLRDDPDFQTLLTEQR